MKTLLVALLSISAFAATDLHDAASRGDLVTLKKGVRTQTDATATNASGETLLQQAAGSGSREAVEFLLAKKADVNARDKSGETPLMTAIAGGNESIALLLVQKGADLGLRYGEKQETIAFEATRVGQLKTLREILKRKPSLANEKDSDGETPLFEAVRSAQSEAAKVLLAAGAKKGEKNKAGQTPLDLANPHTDQKLIEILK